MAKVLFRLDVSNAVGGGHLKRCLSLASLFDRQDVLFVVHGEESYLEHALRGFRFHVLPADLPFSAEYEALTALIDLESCTAMFFDFSHAGTYAQLPALAVYLGKLARHALTTVLIDGLGEDSILSRDSGLELDFVVTPYVGAEAVKGSFTHLFGPEYFVLDPARGTRPETPRPISPVARKLLVTMGLSDPQSMTLRILGAIHGLPQTSIKVAVGRLFAPALKERLNELASTAPRSIGLLKDCEDLSGEFAQADLVISASGLTKYELAYCGTPAVIVSPNAGMARVSEAFDRAGSSLHLGSIDAIKDEDLLRKLTALAGDRAARAAMSEKGRKLIDGKGAQRIVDRVLRGS